MTDPGIAPLPITWHACDLLTGNRLGELALKPQGPLVATMMRPEALSFTLDVADIPGVDEWPIRTQAPQTLIVGDVAGSIIWGGIVWKRQHTPQTIVVSTLTAESIFDRRYMPVDPTTATATYPNTEQTAIVADIVSNISDYGFLVTTPASEPSVPVQLVVSDSDNKKVSDVLNELAGHLNGAEWTVTLNWADDSRTQVIKTVISSFRIGTSAPDQPAPTVALYDQTQLRDWTITDADWSDGAGATSVTAFSNSGVGGANAYSADHLSTKLLAGGVPLLQERFSPASAIGETDDPTLDTASGLNGHAAGRLAEIGQGTRTIDNCVFAAGAGPLPGRDFMLGDYFLIEITDTRRWRNTQHFPVRIVSWSVSVTDGYLGDLTPTFWVDDGSTAS